ncbi:MAG: BREX-1 system phosphatase PglZ type B, partial [Planctomycetes bacterium]|nr:BREX-1 system phosphatase PglZ type B [Planctomycetota bacterium]
RSWVWARLGLSPFAIALESLAVVAAIARRPLSGATIDEIADGYAKHGWRADAAAWQTLAGVPLQHETTLREVVQQLAEPWLEETAIRFQELFERGPSIAGAHREAVDAAEGGCLVFVDGLRYELGCLLAERLEGRGCRVAIARRWAALPTVTATGKPAVTPVVAEVSGTKLGEDFAPRLRGGKAIDAASLRAAIESKGYQILGAETGDWPLAATARGFLEAGDIDSLGHERQGELPAQLWGQIQRLEERIVRLLDAGWTSVRVVTDHGWLFLPEGLPTAELPRHLTLRRWARCAVISGDSQVEVPRVAWHWNPNECAATAPGSACFNGSLCYAHGGLSIQECLTPDLLVTRSGARTLRASIKSLTWRGMRCLVVAESSGGEVRADLRLSTASGASVVKAPKMLDADGATSLVVADDRHESAPLMLVLLAPDHSVIAQQATKVGASS